jgi:hypothetical protein
MIKKITILIIGFLLIAATETKASHLSAAEFQYTHISGNDYLVSLYLYRDCSGIGMPSSVSVNMSSVNCGISNNVTLSQFGTATYVLAIPGGQTTCQGGVIPGYEEFVYQATITMPAQCTDWIFSWSNCCRNAAITNLVNPSSKSIYIESTMNNTVVNNSPKYYIDPLFYGSMGSNFSVALGGYDIDGDQLLFRLEAPLDNAMSPIPFATGLSVAQPLTVLAGTPVNFSPATGQFSCVLGASAQIVVFDIIVEEYRSGVLIASHRRSFQILPINTGGHSMTAPSIGISANGTVVDQYRMEYTSAGQPFSFSMIFTDNDVADVITYNAVHSSIMARFPDAQVTTSYPGGTAQNILQLGVTLPTPAPALFNILLEENGFLQHSFSYEIAAAATTSVEALDEKSTVVNVYPNPMEASTTFEILEGNYQEFSLQIFDLTGRSIYNQSVQGGTQVQFNRNDIPAGMYIYKLRGDNQLIKADLLEMK